MAIPQAKFAFASFEDSAHHLHQAITTASKANGQAKKDAEFVIIGIITAHENEQLEQLAKEYNSKYGQALPEAIKTVAGHGDFEKLLVDLIIPRAQFAARTIHNAITGAGTDEHAIIDSIVHVPHAELAKIREAYSQIFSQDLAVKVKNDLSGNFGKAVASILEHHKDSIGNPEAEAENLYKKGEGKWGTDDDYFVQFFTRHSYDSLQAVNRAYHGKYNHTLEVAIKKETSGDYQNILVALVQSREEYWARRIHHAIAGLGTNDTLLRRAFVLNNKAQLNEIARKYEELFPNKNGPALYTDVKEDTSGYYQHAFLSVLQNI